MILGSILGRREGTVTTCGPKAREVAFTAFWELSVERPRSPRSSRLSLVFDFVDILVTVEGRLFYSIHEMSKE